MRIEVNTSGFGKTLMFLSQLILTTFILFSLYIFPNLEIVGQIFIPLLDFGILIMIWGMCRYYFQPESVVQIEGYEIKVFTRSFPFFKRFNEKNFDLTKYQYFTETSKSGFLLFSTDLSQSNRFDFFAPNNEYLKHKPELAEKFRILGLTYMTNKECEKYNKEIYAKMKQQRK